MDLEKFLVHLFKRIKKTADCWIWIGAQNQAGYGIYDGTLNEKYKRWYVHRLTFCFFKGKINPILEIDHLCRNTSCCNPDHLEAVTPKENKLRGIGVGAKNSKKKFCINGHRFDEKNTYFRKHFPGQRICRACINLRKRNGRKKKKTL